MIKETPAMSRGFYCWGIQRHGQGITPHELGTTKQRGIIPAPSHPLQSASLSSVLIRTCGRLPAHKKSIQNSWEFIAAKNISELNLDEFTGIA